MKWLGAILVMAGCGGWGLMMAANDRAQERSLRRLLQALEWLKSELSCRMWPLPALFRQVSERTEGEIRCIFREVAEELDKREAAEAGECMDLVLSRYPGLHEINRHILSGLGRGLGTYDLEGQLRELESRALEAREALERRCKGADQRRRSYRTLGICAGAGLALLLF